MCFFALLYGVVALNLGGEWMAAMMGLGGCYLIAFAAVVSPWFWGRWYAAGLSWSGALIGGVSLIMLGWSWPLALYAGLHGAALLCLSGKSMSGDYELQTAWRERFKMDDLGVSRLGKTVTRSAASLPSVVLWALGPKDPGQGLATVGGLLAVTGVVFGFRALVRLRTWGLFAVAAAVLLAGGLSVFQTAHASCSLWLCQSGARVATGWMTMASSQALRPLAAYLAGGFAVAILLPFVVPALAYLRRR